MTSFIKALIFFAGVSNFIIGIFVFLKNTKNKINITFALFATATSLWVFSNLLLYFYNNYYLLRSTFAIGAVIPFFMVLWIYFFKEKNYFFYKAIVGFTLIGAIIFFTLSFVDDLIVQGTLASTKLFEPFLKGKLFIYYAAYTSTAIFIPLIFLLRELKKSIEIRKQQVKYMLFGLFLFSIGPVVLSFLLPIIGIEKYSAFDNIFSLFFMVFTAYSIAFHRLFDIRIFLRRAFVIGGALIVSVAINMNLLYLDAVVFNWFIPAAVAGPIALVLGIGLFEWFRKLFLKFANKYFFTTLYDQQHVLEDLASKMSRTIQLREVVETVSQTISKTLGIEHYGIYFLTKNKNDNYKPQTLIEAGFETNTSQKILNDQFLYSYLSKSNEALVREEMVRFLEEETARPKHTTEHLRVGLTKLIEELKQAGIAVVVPLTSSGNLVSIIFLGNKLTKDAFTVQDIHLLETIADQAAVAIENARLYEEAQQFTIKLKHEVEKATAELKEANAQLKELDQAKSEFMSIASHQLRTPLAGIIGYLSMLLEGDYGKLTKQNQPVVSDVFQAAQRLVRLVNTFLNVTRIEAGRFTLTYVPINIVNMINDEVKELQPTADKRNLKLIFNKPKSADVQAEVDEKMREVFINLIDNAIKYTQEGSVTVGVEPEGKADIHLTVTDTGIGIAKGDAEHLFEKFVRGSSVARVQPNGSGLGLYIVKQIVEGHHGKIWAASEGVGKGTTFHVVIPTKQKTKEFKADAKRVFHTESIVNRDPNAPLQQLSAPTTNLQTMNESVK